MVTNENIDATQLDWLTIQDDKVARIPAQEAFLEKLSRKTRENPFVPIGCIATVSALSMGLWNFYQGNARQSQMMMRARVLAQSLTIAALVIGLTLTVPKKSVKD